MQAILFFLNVDSGQGQDDDMNAAMWYALRD
jgi:hypothetical protein